MHVPRSTNRLIALLVALLFGLAGQTVSAQQVRRPVRKKPKLTFVMTNPVSKIKLTFQEPALLEETGEVAAWRKITIHLPDDTFTIDAGADAGYMIDTKSTNSDSWSPDGKYIALYQSQGILDRKRFTTTSLVFLDLEYGEPIAFQARNRQTIGKDDFRGWVATKPHVVKLTGNAAKPASNNQVPDEAYPADELPKP